MAFSTSEYKTRLWRAMHLTELMYPPPSKRRRSDFDNSQASSPESSITASTIGSPLGISVATGYTPPGRLGAYRMEVGRDIRLDARLLTVLTNYGLHVARTPTPLALLTPNSSLEEIKARIQEADRDVEGLCEHLPNNLPHDDLELQVEYRRETITGQKWNSIDLHIYRPVVKGGPLPCILQCHGGGSIASFGLNNKVYIRWCRSLAAQGMVVISVDYRDPIHLAEGLFPNGLNDICAATVYVHSHRSTLNIRNIVLQGDAMGANLVLAAAIKAKQDGWSNKIDGVYAQSPMISNAYNWSEARKLQELPSLLECHGYLVNVDYMAYAAHLYTPRSVDGTNPLAWPHHANRLELQGLPPHVLALDELDPLRSEGEAYLRKLVQAGVPAVGHVNLGTVHGASLIFRQAVPELHRAAVRSVAAFAKQV
ncbi:hypothetical protein LTS14_007421 [Recurvomyces mirabilis]|nr:hypothetical protein LTS14_007421 [Recurvomyces mirabilis]